MTTANLFCIDCGEIFSSSELSIICDQCGGTLEVELIDKARISDQPILQGSILNRYKSFYPYLDTTVIEGLGEGFTPLVEVPALAQEHGIEHLYFKNETQNPTWSFKDRGTVTGVAHALTLNFSKIGTVSTGNMAVSVAAYGSRAGLDTYILVNDQIAQEKLLPIAIYKPDLVKVSGDYGQLYYKSLELGREHGIYFINSDVPFRVEGYKTLSFEICEQMNFEVPDYVIVPTSAGGNLRGIIKGFEEFLACGYIDRLPTFVCAQASGCAPIVEAAKSEKDRIERFNSPSTIAHAIENPLPPSGNAVLKKLKALNGQFVAVTDEEIIKAQAKIAEAGMFVQPASAVSYAAVSALRKEGILTHRDKVVCILTGSGLKYTAAFEKHQLDIMTSTLEALGDFISEHTRRKHDYRK